MPMQKNDRDYAKRNSGGMGLFELERLLSDMENEPAWRPEADKCADYYDHKQSTAEQIERARQTGEPLITVNLIQRTVNGALGQEAKTRLNWKVEADTQAFADVAAVQNERMHEAQRETAVNTAISEAYKSQLITGIGWVEVSRNPDPLAYPYRVVPVHRNEVFCDWRAKAPDKSDARWIVRKRWVDIEEAITAMPQFRDIFEVGCHSGPITDVLARTMLTSRERFDAIHDIRRAFRRHEEEWLDNSNRKRVCFYSVYYRQPSEQVALAYGTRRVKFNAKNPLHQVLVQNGAAKLLKGPSHTIRHAMFAGPYRLFDVELPGRRFPLVPFVCYSCDDDGSPYGLVHGMIGPQDEFNKRRSRLMWLLSAKQVFVDNDALDPKWNTFAQVATEVMRPDAFFVLDANRRNANGLVINSNLGLQREQAEVMADAKQLIQDVPGLYNALLGNNKDGATSGVALNNLLDQSINSLGETTDNYRSGRLGVGELLCELIAEDLGSPNMSVEVGTGQRRRTVVLNAISPETGLPFNNVEDSATRVALSDVPQTQAYKAQQQLQLANMIGQVGNDPVARPILVAAMLETSDLEHGPAYAKWIRNQMGIPDPNDMGDDEKIAQEQQQKAAQTQQAQQLQQAAVAAELKEKEAGAAQKASAAQLNQARAYEVAMNAQIAQQQAMAANEDALVLEAMQEALGARTA